MRHGYCIPTGGHLDTTLSALDTLGYRVVLEANPYGNEDCYMNPNTNTSEIWHNGIGLPTRTTHPATPRSDDFHELVCIFQRSLNTGNPDDLTTRPHKITLHMSGVDLIRLVQLAMYPTGERK